MAAPNRPSPTSSPSPTSEFPQLSPSVSPGSQPRDSTSSSYFRNNGPTSPRLETIKEGTRHGSISFGPVPESKRNRRDGMAQSEGGNGGEALGKTISFGSEGSEGKRSGLGRRRSSPPPQPKYTSHVSFSNVTPDPSPNVPSNYESSQPFPTEHNACTFTLNSRHSGYSYKRSSRTFLCGLDANEYSDYALQWMLDEMVDDGDNVICVRVLEKPLKAQKGEKEKECWQREARKVMQGVIERVSAGGKGPAGAGREKAIAVTVELAVGKREGCFQKMIQVYEPSMLIVGTKGRSLGGMQSLLSNRNSFSKWCLQYSPIPVVVVRPTEKREKKKEKRMNDPNRQSYAAMLAESGGHEADSLSTPLNEKDGEKKDGREVEVLEPISKEEEMHKVAAALGLPSRFDPMVKEVDLSERLEELRQKRRGSQDQSNLSSPAGSRGTSPAAGPRRGSLLKTKLQSPGVSDNEADDGDASSEGDDGDDGIRTGETMGANVQAVDDIEKKEKLSKMEKGEAAALARGRERGSVSSVESTG